MYLSDSGFFRLTPGLDSEEHFQALNSCSIFLYSLLYGAEDPSIAGMVLDSGFTNLYGLMLELVDVYKIRVPKFTVRASPEKSVSQPLRNDHGNAALNSRQS